MHGFLNVSNNFPLILMFVLAWFHFFSDLISIRQKLWIPIVSSIRFFINHKVKVLLLPDHCVPDLVIAVVKAVRRSKGAVLEVVGEFAVGSWYDHLVRTESFDVPVTQFAFSLIVVDSWEAAKEAVSHLPLTHLQNEILIRVNRRIVIAFFVDVVGTKLDHSSKSVE